jgi:sugar lactone lactonase YvrE
MGGAVQGGTISAKFANYSVATLAGIADTAGLNDSSVTTAARFNHPTDITTDGTTLYIADYLNNVVRQIDVASGTVTTLKDLAGTTIAFNRPSGITTTVTSAGPQLYVVDSGTNTIRIINLTTKIVTTIGSSNSLVGAVDSTVPSDVRFNQPTGITTDGVSIYVADSGNHTVRRIVVDAAGTISVSTLAGSPGSPGTADDTPGTHGAARFNLPARITTDGTRLYLTDFNNRTIRQIDIVSGTVTTLAGTTGLLGVDDGTLDGSGTAARFNQPNGITTDGVNLYVTDSYQNTIRKIVIASGVVTTISGTSKLSSDPTIGIGGAVDSPGVPSFYTPIGITTNGTSLFVADSYNSTIRRIQ